MGDGFTRNSMAKPHALDLWRFAIETLLSITALFRVPTFLDLSKSVLLKALFTTFFKCRCAPLELIVQDKQSSQIEWRNRKQSSFDRRKQRGRGEGVGDLNESFPAVDYRFGFCVPMVERGRDRVRLLLNWT